MIGSSESWGLNSNDLHGTHVPVEEPSTASTADIPTRAGFDAWRQRYVKMVPFPVLQSSNWHAWAKMPISPFQQNRRVYSSPRRGETRRRNPGRLRACADRQTPGVGK